MFDLEFPGVEGSKRQGFVIFMQKTVPPHQPLHARTGVIIHCFGVDGFKVRPLADYTLTSHNTQRAINTGVKPKHLVNFKFKVAWAANQTMREILPYHILPQIQC